MPPNLADRVQRVRLLLDTLNDPYPTPRGALRPDAGPAPSKYVPCLTCQRQGWLMKRGRTILCLACDGTGNRRRRSDEEPWDMYLNVPLGDAVAVPREPMSLRAIEEQVAEQEGRYEALSYGWERLQRAYQAHGSYRELRRCLGWLQRVQPRRYRLVRTVLVEHEPRQLTAGAALDLDLGVVAITLRMRTVRVPPWLMEHRAADERQQTIAALAAEGFGAGAIARKLGISKEVVRRRLKGLPARAVDSGVAGIPLGAM
jgi:hypothetical protein